MSNSFFQRSRYLRYLLILLAVVVMAAGSVARADTYENFSLNNYPSIQLDPALSAPNNKVTLSGTLNYDVTTGKVVAQGTTFTITDALGSETGSFPIPLVGTQGVYAAAGALYVSADGTQLMLKGGGANNYFELYNANASPSFTPASGSAAYISLLYNSTNNVFQTSTNAEFPGQLPSIVDEPPSFVGTGIVTGNGDWDIATYIPPAAAGGGSP